MTQYEDPSESDQTPPSESPARLNYQWQGNEAYRSRTPVGMQVFAGFLAWLVGVGFVVQVARSGMGNIFGMTSGNVIVVAIGAAVLVLGVMAIWLRVRFGWRGFAPGLLIGFGLTCLVPVGIVLVVCGGIGKTL